MLNDLTTVLPRVRRQPVDGLPTTAIVTVGAPPVFVDDTGRRRRAVLGVGATLAAVCLVYLGVVVLGVVRGAENPLLAGGLLPPGSIEAEPGPPAGAPSADRGRAVATVPSGPGPSEPVAMVGALPPGAPPTPAAVPPAPPPAPVDPPLAEAVDEPARVVTPRTRAAQPARDAQPARADDTALVPAPSPTDAVPAEPEPAPTTEPTPTTEPPAPAAEDPLGPAP